MIKSHYLTLLALVLLALALPAVASAQPTNDDFVNATVIGSLPYSNTVDMAGTTLEAGEPTGCNNPQGTVWYSFTASADTLVAADESDSYNYDTYLAVWQATGSGLSGLTLVNCTSYYGSGFNFQAHAGTTYYIQAGYLYNIYNPLTLNLRALIPPPNDNFAGAAAVTALPFTNSVDATATTLESGEPVPSCGSPLGTVWYSFTPSTTGSVEAQVSNNYWNVQAVYTGTWPNLTQLQCQNFNPLTFRADAGTTYYFQVGPTVNPGPLTFSLQVAPPPVAQFGYYPSSPSVFDVVSFYDFSNDPAGAGIQSRTWNFGDGTTSTSSSPSHQYAKDGSYNVVLAITTTDGRTASTSQVVTVRTDDVAIVSLQAPTSASTGQTRSITIGVTSRRYPESVTVVLFKSDPSSYDGYTAIGSLTMSVPVRSANRTTNFAFSYTFTKQDATIGKVSFKAVATINGYRDAAPADNTLISPPTKVTR